MDRGQRKPNSSLPGRRCMRTMPHLYNKGFPYYREPVEVGSFSVDINRQYRNDRSQLKLFAPPPDWKCCKFDLKDGYKDMIKRNESFKGFLDNLLRWIVNNKQKFYLQNPSTKDSAMAAPLFKSLNTDFVNWRGCLTRVMCIPYETQEDLMIAVIHFRGTYYMCEFDTDARKQRMAELTPRQEEFFAWGYRFEQYVTAAADKTLPDSPFNNNEEFGSVVRGRLESHSLLFGAEVDCEDPRCKTGNRYIELKTSRHIETHRQHENFCKFKLVKWWAQSFLVGIPRIVCGFRNDDGIVHELQNFPVKDMPKLTESIVGDYAWKPAICFNFLNEFLICVKSVATEDNPRIAYVFRWQPHSDMTWERRMDDPTFCFLPDWFIQWEAWDQPCTV